MKSSLFCDIMQHRLVVTSVSGQPFGHIFKVQAVQGDCLTPEDQTNGLSWNVRVTNYQYLLHNIAEEWRSDIKHNCLGALVSLVMPVSVELWFWSSCWLHCVTGITRVIPFFWQLLCMQYVARILKLANTNIQVYTNVLLTVTVTMSATSSLYR